MKQEFAQVNLETTKNIEFIAVNDALQEIVDKSAVREGMVCLSGNHTTTAVSVNENEERLLDDITQFMQRLAPSDGVYLHNDIHLRDCPPDEPENAHAHLLAMTFGNSETIPIHQGKLMLGKWQSVFFIELDGPRTRTLNVQVMGQ